jgi:hypothetical protein
MNSHDLILKHNRMRTLESLSSDSLLASRMNPPNRQGQEASKI